MQYIRDETIDLIYLDLPFNSNVNYNVIFKTKDAQDAPAQIEAFEDTWNWNPESELAYSQIMGMGDRVSDVLAGLRQAIGENNMLAYVTMMAIRLLELHRVLKKTGSLYLHCDPTASHYLKIILDAIFGVENFRNEIIWERSHTRSLMKKNLRKAHDVILRYTKSKEFVFNMQYKELSEASKSLYSLKDDVGYYRHVPLMVSGKLRKKTSQIWRGINPRLRGKSGMNWITIPEKLE